MSAFTEMRRQLRLLRAAFMDRDAAYGHAYAIDVKRRQLADQADEVPPPGEVLVAELHLEGCSECPREIEDGARGLAACREATQRLEILEPLNLAALCDVDPAIAAHVEACPFCSSDFVALAETERDFLRVDDEAITTLWAAAVRILGDPLALFRAWADSFRPTTTPTPVQRRVLVDPSRSFAVLSSDPARVPLLVFTFAALFLWPLPAALLAFAVLYVSYGEPIAAWGRDTVVWVAASGAFVCGMSVSIAAAAAAGVPLALTMGAGYAWMLGHHGVDELLARFAAAAPIEFLLGGVAALETPPFLFVLAFVASLSLLSLMMAKTARLTIGDLGYANARVAAPLAIAIGSAPIGISLFGTLFIQQASPEAPRWLLLALPALLCGVAVAAAIALRTGERLRSAAFGGAAALLMGAVSWEAFGREQDALSDLGWAVVAHISFHGTFFALTYVIAERLAGRWFAALAATIEGVGGYLGFVAAVAVDWQWSSPTFYLLMRHVHVLAFGSLFAFLVCGQVWHLSAIRTHDVVRRADLYERLETFVRRVPTLAAPAIALSGLALFEIRELSLTEGWPLLLVVLFGIEMADGIAHYTPYSKRLRELARGDAERGAMSQETREAMTGLADNLSLWVHILAFCVIYWLPVARPQFAIPLAALFRQLEIALGLYLVPPALVLGATVGLVIGARKLLAARNRSG